MSKKSEPQQKSVDIELLTQKVYKLFLEDMRLNKSRIPKTLSQFERR
jgi:hypothetical protein